MGTKEENKKLIEKYPFLHPVFGPSGEKVQAGYDYSYTELDAIPEGWRKAFGNLMIEDVAAVLKRADYLDKYSICQIKEKFGELRWYDNGVPDSIYDELSDVIVMYEHISGYTCIKCGAFPAKMRSVHGWISPYCDRCAEGMKDVRTLDSPPFKTEICVTQFGKGERMEKVLDCSNIIRRMQDNNSAE